MSAIFLLLPHVVTRLHIDLVAIERFAPSEEVLQVLEAAVHEAHTMFVMLPALACRLVGHLVGFALMVFFTAAGSLERPPAAASSTSIPLCAYCEAAALASAAALACGSAQRRHSVSTLSLVLKAWPRSVRTFRRWGIRGRPFEVLGRSTSGAMLSVRS